MNERGLYSSHGQVMVHHCGMPREELKQGRNLKVKTEAETSEKCGLLSCLSTYCCLPTQPKTTSQGIPWPLVA